MRARWNARSYTLLVVGLTGAGGCGEAFVNLTASLGGNVSGGRGNVQVLFINNTPHRAVFTFGSYDPLDQFSRPDFDQFGAEDVGPTLEGESVSDILTIDCARVFSIGGPLLLEFIDQNQPDASIDPEAFVEGVDFLETPTDEESDDSAEDRPSTVGSAPPFEAQLGVDFPCGALLIIRLEFDDLGSDPFRVDFELIPSESSR